MKYEIALVFAVISAFLSSAAAAEMVQGADGAPGTADGPYLQCVPYARDVSGVQIYGDAHTWWNQAEGRYARGDRPRVGAVMAFQPHRNMHLGHVAAVSRIIDDRTVLLRHANWSLIDGRRGQIEDDVRAVDVSPENDWSQVRVWYAPIGALGGTAWPIHGFIYNDNTDRDNNRQISSRHMVRAEPRGRVSFASAMAMDDLPAADSFEASFASLR